MDNYWFLFWAFLGTILGPILGPDRPKRGQDEPKRAIRSFKEPKSCIFKNLEKPAVFSVFGSRGLPREPQEAREGSQETPKETPKGGPKLGQKVAKKCTQKWAKKASKVNSKNRSDRGLFGRFWWPWGLPKTLTEDALKKFYRQIFASPKTVPNWFQNGSRLPKLLKIAPKIRPYKDL